MIEAAFGTALMALAGGAHRRLARRRATRGRAIRVAAIARHADRKDAITASTDFLAKRRIHDVEAAARFDWTRRSNRGTTETTGSVRRSIEAVTEGLEVKLQAFTSIRHTAVSLQQSSEFGGGARRQLLPSVGVITTAAERLQGSSMTADQMKVRFDDRPDLRGFR